MMCVRGAMGGAAIKGTVVAFFLLMEATLMVAAPRGRAEDRDSIPLLNKIPPKPVQIKAAPAAIEKRQTINAQQFHRIALNIQQQYPVEFQKHLRFVAIQDGIELGHEQVNYLANAVYARNTNRVVPEEIYHPNVAVLEFHRLVPNLEERIVALRNYEELVKVDSFFGSSFAPAPASQFNVDSLKPDDKLEVQMSDGTWQQATFQSIKDGVSTIKLLSSGKVVTAGKKFLRAAFIEPTIAAPAHLGDDGVRLIASTGSSVPVMELTEWVNASFSSLSKQGGQYYLQAGVRKSQVEGRTDFEQWLIDNNASIEIVEKAGSQSKSLTLISNVTHKTRITVMFYTLASRPEIGPSVCFLTFDVSYNNFNDGTNPLEDVINFDSRKARKFAGIEAIVIRPNGFQQYAAFDKDLALVEEVPGDIARDSEASPHSGQAVIFSGASCMRCHEKTEERMGYQSITNDALTLKTGDAENGIIAELSNGKISGTEDLEKFLSQFGGRPERVIQPARIMFDGAVFDVTEQSPFIMGKALSKSYEKYADLPVTPEDALRDLGWIAKEGEGKYVLRELLPLVQADDGIVVAGNTVRGFRENSSVQWLKLGASVTGQQWRLYRKQAMLRVQFTEEQLRQQKQKEKEEEGDKK